VATGKQSIGWINAAFRNGSESSFTRLTVLESSSFPLRLRPRVIAMSSPIAIREFDADEYRKFVQTLSDEELVKAGRRPRILSGDGKIVSTTPCVFDQQLRIYTEEYRRRHPN
jgi:hypothetical protein